MAVNIVARVTINARLGFIEFTGFIAEVVTLTNSIEPLSNNASLYIR